MKNTGDTALSYIYVLSTYSNTGLEGDSADMPALGQFSSLPAGVTQPEDGLACIESLDVGESVVLSQKAVVPESFAGEKIVFTFMTLAMGTEDFDETGAPLAADFTELSGQILADTSENPGTENPGTDNPGTEDPGTENPGTDTPGIDDPGTDNPNKDTEKPVITDPSKPADTKPVKEETAKTDNTKKTDTKSEKKDTAPKTGDPVSAAGTVAVMLGAAAVLSVSAGKRSGKSGR